MFDRRHLIYCWLPTAVTALLVAMYFSNVPLLTQLVCPRLEGIKPNSWREFGLLENLQHLTILAIIVVCGRATRASQHPLERWGYAFATLLSTFILLEEIDYGLHYYDYLLGIAEPDDGPRNLHNQGEATNVIKMVVDTALALWFVVAPLALRRVRQPLIRYLLPSTTLIWTLIGTTAMAKLATFLAKSGLPHDGLGGNLSEFRELGVYYLALLYLYDLSQRSFPWGPAAVPTRTQ